MINWFPLSKSMMEDSTEFRGLTVTERLYYILTLSELNLRGQFYRADLEMAAMLGLSEDKIRRARRKLQGMEWLTIKPGFKSNGKGVATTYIDAKWNGTFSGDYYSKIHRYALESMLHNIREKRFTHPDVLVYIYLCYFYDKNKGKNNGKFFKTKTSLQELTGIPGVVGCVNHLYQGFVFTGNAHLFEYQDKYHKLVFDSWSAFQDPSAGEGNRKLAEIYREEVTKIVIKAKKEKVLRDKDYSSIKPEHLPEIYKQWIIGTCYALGPRQKAELIALGNSLGAANVARKIDMYMDNAGSKSFPGFIKSVKG